MYIHLHIVFISDCALLTKANSAFHSEYRRLVLLQQETDWVCLWHAGLVFSHLGCFL